MSMVFCLQPDCVWHDAVPPQSPNDTKQSVYEGTYEQLLMQLTQDCNSTKLWPDSAQQNKTHSSNSSLPAVCQASVKTLLMTT